MATLFLICAAVGGTILACQLVMTLLGFAGDMAGVDLPDDIGGGGDLDLGGDVDIGGNLAMDADVDAGGDVHHPDTSWILGVLSFRTLVAAVTFFGLTGMIARGANAGPTLQVVVALAGGAAAMFGVYWLMRAIYSMKAEGTVRIGNTVGRHGTVYLRIPAKNAGVGKVQLSVQTRTMEYLAMTPGHELPTGTKVRVVGVVASDTVEVEPVLEPERAENV